MTTKYVKIVSEKNQRGIVMEELDIEGMKEHYFDGHKEVQIIPISREEYLHSVYGQ